MKSLFRLLLITFTIIITSITQQAYSQKNEVGVMIGGAYYMGDLNPYQHFAMPRYSGGLIYRRNFTPHFSARLNALYASIQADDSSIGYKPERNLNFRSSIYEISLQAEINFLPFITGDKENPNSFYIFGGVGGFRYNPKANYNGQWIELQPLGTEGQGTDLYPDRNTYSLYSYNFIFGIGMKFVISKNMALGIEWGMRRTGTDYLDDVSTRYPEPSVLSGLSQELSNRSTDENIYPGMQRGNPYNKDWYSIAGLKVTYRIKNQSTIKCHTYD
ncbi:MAG: DUF6089 family protein [Bacteroidales bacterium]